MINRTLSAVVQQALTRYPAVAILGPRQVGKTTLALQQVSVGKETVYLDLERPSDLFKLSDAETFLGNQQEKTVIIDEVQRKPELFPLLRSLIDTHRVPGRFLLLGSASEALQGLASDILAGRVSYQELHPFSIDETQDWQRLWVHGGYPPAFLSDSEEEGLEWVGNFVRTYLEHELGQASLRVTAPVLGQFLRVLASVHGQLLNYSQLANALQLSVPTVKNYIRFFEQAYMLRLLAPWHTNVGKRLVKSPKLYFRDSGMLHYLRGIDSLMALEGDILKGSSWEGFAMQQLLAHLKPSVLPYFYRTSSGAETDLVLVKGNRPFAAFEFKYSNSPKVTKGNTEAFKDLDCPHRFIVTPTSARYEWRPNLWVTGLPDLPQLMRELNLW